MSRKPILCLDFDGVLHGYQSGWMGAGKCPDPPVPGAVEFVYEAVRHFRVMVYSSRSKSLAGRWAMRAWLREHFDIPLTFVPDHYGHCQHDWLYEAVEFPWFKPPALLTIDDRALTFEGTWPTIDAMKAFQPWNKRSPTPSRAGCLLCAHGNDLPDGEWCRACGLNEPPPEGVAIKPAADGEVRDAQSAPNDRTQDHPPGGHSHEG